MKYIGFLMFIAGLFLLMYAFTMDTSVAVEYPNGNYYDMPDRVNNLGLMADKQNYMIFGVVLTVLGFLTINSYSKKSTDEDVLKTCPKCAEKVKNEAQICRFCKHEFLVDNEVRDEIVNINDLESEKIRRNLSAGNFN